MTTAAGDLFPPEPRVFYRKAPLVQVTCQLRFPALLAIEKHVPAEFQERIRDRFPKLDRPANIQLPPGLPAQITESIRAQAGASGWRFWTEDKNSAVVGLSPDSLTLTTKTYRTWTEFLERWRPAFRALSELYQPNYLEQVSLRYQDVIVRENLNLDPTTPWSDLLRSELLGEASIRAIEERMVDATRFLRLRLPDGCVLALQHGLAKQVGGGQVAYVIDLDFATTSKVGINDAEHALDRLHQNVWRVFKWCITNKLHVALEPTDHPDVGL